MYKDSFTFDLGHFIFRRMKLSKLTTATWLLGAAKSGWSIVEA